MKIDLADVDENEMCVFLDEIVDLMTNDFANTFKIQLLNEHFNHHLIPFFVDKIEGRWVVLPKN